MDPKFTKPYNPAGTEARIYKQWEESGYFNPDNLPYADKGPFTIILPPPNVTGRLHMGHALMLALQDIFIRFKRMQGYKTLWLPGTDHAAIATQSVVEKQIKKEEDKSRHDLGREEMLQRIEKFAEASHDTIIGQVKAMGASLDWSREAFTLDEKRSKAVHTVFKQMYDGGLIYRGNRIVNWDPKGQTTISDDEIVYEERASKLYTFRYSKNFPIPVATTRPETKVGDVAVAVHPDDARYNEFIGKEYEVIFCDVPIKIKVVADEAADPSFGTGAVGVTPAHSFTDWEIAERNNLPKDKTVINEFAKMTVEGRLNNKKTSEAREIVVEWLKNEGLIEKVEDTQQSVATAERTGGVIEPLPKLQWWVAVNKPIQNRGDKTLKELMLEPIKNGEIKIIPDYFDKTYYHWIENLRDWCISRQIWYGHRIPVWYRGEEIAVGEAPRGEGWTQDEDTLDTWFSSGLWTFSTLGWPEETKDLQTYHPTDVLETGHDILFFWVARMILMTEFTLGTIPFKTVYLHGLVRDAKGQKMSKSLGNALDPLEIAGKYGADAARMALVVGNTPGTDTRISEDKIKGYKHFANKLWNISRYVLESTKQQTTNNKLNDEDGALLTECNTLTKEVTEDIENYRAYLAAEKIYHYVWHRLADEILEESKPILSGTDEATKQSRSQLLLQLLTVVLKLLHPFMPFVTEEIWQSMGNKELLMITKWPA
jgi:valyl-tRNA synthetase